MAIRVDGHDGLGSLLVLRGESERGVRIVLRGIPAKQHSVSKTRVHTKKTLYLYICDLEPLPFVMLFYCLKLSVLKTAQTHRVFVSSVFNPDLVGAASFCRIWIGIQNQVISENLEKFSGTL
jgi:hypothetical protein